MCEPVTWLDRAVVPAGPYLALCLSEAAFRSAMADLGVSRNCDWVMEPHADATAHYFDNSHDGGLAVIVCLRNWEGRPPTATAAMLVHEAVHAWQQYALRIREEIPGSEQQAYGIQYIAQSLMEEFARQTAPENRKPARKSRHA